jgi:ATP-dependent Clp protease protease subunit
MMKKIASKEQPLVTKEVRFDSASFWLNNGVDFESRRIHVDMDVDNIMSSIIIRALLKMSENNNSPIEIYISSFGGVVHDGLAIYDAIRACPCEVFIYGFGKVMSSAFIIFLAGDQRLCAQNTTFMMHTLSYSGEGKLKDQEIDVQEAKRLNNVFLDILAERTKRNRKWWYRQIISHDKHFDLTQARDCGLLTEVTRKVKNEKTIKKVTKPKAKIPKVLKKPKPTTKKRSNKKRPR